MSTRVSICIPEELLFKIKAHTNNISQFFKECAEEKIKDKNSILALHLIDTFPCQPANESTLEALSRSRNEE